MRALLPCLLLSACASRCGATGPAVADDTGVPGADSGEDTAGPPIPEGYALLHVPSEAAGEEGVLVRVAWPSSQRARYGDRAPVAVEAPGAWGPGAIPPEEGVIDQLTLTGGVIWIELVLPGGEWHGGEEISGGAFDYRGAGSARAFADVLRFAGGLIPSVEGQYLADVVPSAWPDRVGVLGDSNGANLALVALATHDELYPGEPLPPIAWVVDWESPLGDQFASSELSKNPYYVPGTCAVEGCPLPGLEAELRFDPAFPTPLALGEDTIEVEGRLFLDGNGSGAYDEGERFFQPISGPALSEGAPLTAYPSLELLSYLADFEPQVFAAGGPPAWLATAEQAAEWWAWRDGLPAVAALALDEDDGLDPAVMVLASVEDHVQTTPDHAHSRTEAQAWMQAGHPFVRFNPDSAYLAALSGADPALLPDNPAGALPPYPGIDEWLVPEEAGGEPIEPHFLRAGILEMCDRAEAGEWAEDLDAVLYP